MKTIQAHEPQAVVEADQSIRISDLPFNPGQKVEVIVLKRDEPASTNGGRYPLRSQKPYRVDDPSTPIATEDWELLLQR